MNEFEPVSQSQIDRLVDGELSQAERRTVLVALDHDGDGWRRLALAYLESQAVRQALRRNVPPPMVIAPASAPVASTTGRSRGTSRLITAMVMCSVLMFGLGRISKPAVIVDKSTPVRPVNSSPETYRPTDSSSDEALLVADSGASNAVSTVQQQQTLRLELSDGYDGAAQAVEVPMVENSNIDAEDLLNAPPVISDRIQRALLRLGRRVYERRQLYEVTLEDGRHGVVPVSDVLVENAGSDIYQ